MGGVAGAPGPSSQPRKAAGPAGRPGSIVLLHGPATLQFWVLSKSVNSWEAGGSPIVLLPPTGPEKQREGDGYLVPPPQFNQSGLLMSPHHRVKGQREPSARFSRWPAPVWLITGLGLVPRLGALGAGWRPSVGVPRWPPLAGLPPGNRLGSPTLPGAPPAQPGPAEQIATCRGPRQGPRQHPALLLQDAMMGMGLRGGRGSGGGGSWQGLIPSAGLCARLCSRCRVPGKQVLVGAAQPPTAASAFPQQSPCKPRYIPARSLQPHGRCTGCSAIPARNGGRGVGVASLPVPQFPQSLAAPGTPGAGIWPYLDSGLTCPPRHPQLGTPLGWHVLSHGAFPPGIPAFPIKGRLLPSPAALDLMSS